MSIFGVLTSVAGFVTNISVSSLVGNMIGTVTTKTGHKVADKVAIGVGTAVLSCMVGDAAQNYIERRAEDIKKSFTERVDIVDYDKLASSNNEEDNDDNDNENEPEIACGED